MKLGIEAVGEAGGVIEATICYSGDLCDPTKRKCAPLPSPRLAACAREGPGGRARGRAEHPQLKAPTRPWLHSQVHA